jgi:hypothetical protein
MPEMGTAAACSKVKLAGLRAGKVALPRTRVLGERAGRGHDVDLVARTEPGHAAAHSLDDTGEVTG